MISTCAEEPSAILLQSCIRSTPIEALVFRSTRALDEVVPAATINTLPTARLFSLTDRLALGGAIEHEGSRVLRDRETLEALGTEGGSSRDRGSRIERAESA